MTEPLHLVSVSVSSLSAVCFTSVRQRPRKGRLCHTVTAHAEWNAEGNHVSGHYLALVAVRGAGLLVRLSIVFLVPSNLWRVDGDGWVGVMVNESQYSANLVFS